MKVDRRSVLEFLQSGGLSHKKAQPHKNRIAKTLSVGASSGTNYQGGIDPKPHREAPFGRWKTMTFIAALRHDGIAAPCLSDGPINGAVFLAWVQESLVPALKPVEIVIMGNLRSHRSKIVRSAIPQGGAKLFFSAAPSAGLRRHPAGRRADSGYNGLYDPGRERRHRLDALCWAHARRQFFELADIAANARRGKHAPAISPIALQAVKRIDALFDIERSINGLSASERLRVRQKQSAPLLADLKAWLGEERSRLSRSASVAKPIDYLLKRWDRFAAFLGDGRICLSNNSAERALRGFALGRKSWLFAGSERGADRAAFMMTLIMTAKLNSVDPLAWLADVLARIASMLQGQLHKLLPWNWKQLSLQQAVLSYAPVAVRLAVLIALRPAETCGPVS